MRGGRNLFKLLPDAFKGIKQIGVIGWGSQVLFYHSRMLVLVEYFVNPTAGIYIQLCYLISSDNSLFSHFIFF